MRGILLYAVYCVDGCDEIMFYTSVNNPVPEDPIRFTNFYNVDLTSCYFDQTIACVHCHRIYRRLIITSIKKEPALCLAK